MLLQSQTQHEDIFPYKVNIFPSYAALVLFHIRNSGSLALACFMEFTISSHCSRLSQFHSLFSNLLHIIQPAEMRYWSVEHPPTYAAIVQGSVSLLF